ncbi:hypothetical protein Lal_00031832, partial [Lupinus albus]
MIEQKNLVLNKKSSVSYSKFSRFSKSTPYSKSVTIEAKTFVDKKAENSRVGSVVNGSREFKHLIGVEMRGNERMVYVFVVMNPTTRNTNAVEGFNSHQLSLCSLVGLTSKKSLKIGGKLKNKPLVLLIDYGTSHNFIAKKKKLVVKLQLLVEDTLSYVVE